MWSLVIRPSQCSWSCDLADSFVCKKAALITCIHQLISWNLMSSWTVYFQWKIFYRLLQLLVRFIQQEFMPRILQEQSYKFSRSEAKRSGILYGFFLGAISKVQSRLSCLSLLQQNKSLIFHQILSRDTLFCSLPAISHSKRKQDVFVNKVTLTMLCSLFLPQNKAD